MKKMMIALMVAAFSFTAMAQVLVYDYSASFKNLAVSKKSVTQDKMKFTLDSAKVASDKFTGYVVINACAECEGEMATSSIANSEDDLNENDNLAVVYINRKGQKDKNYYYRSLGIFYANMFGEKSGKVDTYWVGDSKFSSASGWLSYTIKFFKGKDAKTANDGFFGRSSKEVARQDYLFYDEDAIENNVSGFLGFPQVFDNVGYGKVERKPVPHDDGCYEYNTYCWKVKNISGNISTTLAWEGVCADFLFDICSQDTDDFAPLFGTWTMKINNKMVFKTFKAADAAIAAGKTIYGDDDEDLFSVKANTWGAFEEPVYVEGDVEEVL